MFNNDDLSVEVFAHFGRIVLRVRDNISSFNIFYSNTFNIESNVKSWFSFLELFVMDFDGFNISFDSRWSESNIHTNSKNSSFNSSDRYSSDSRNLVDILKGKSEGFVFRSFNSFNSINGVNETVSFEPRHLIRFLSQVFSS